MRISDWSSDVCSSDLVVRPLLKLVARLVEVCAVLLQRSAHRRLGMTVRFGGKALPRRFGYGVATVHSARTAEQFFHRLLIERGAALVEAGKKQVLLPLIGFDHQPGEGEESTLSPQQLHPMQARPGVRDRKDIG